MTGETRLSAYTIGRVLVLVLALLAAGGFVTGCFEDYPTEDADTTKAEGPDEYLPAQSVKTMCDGCEEVTQVELDAPDNAAYQYAYESGGSHFIVMTGIEGKDTYRELLLAAEEAEEADADAAKIITVAGVGDGAWIQGSSAVLLKDDETIVLWANTFQDAQGQPYPAATPEELEGLLREIDGRM